MACGSDQGSWVSLDWVLVNSVCVGRGAILQLETLGIFCPQDDKVRERPLLSLWSVEEYFGAVDMLHMAMVRESTSTDGG